MRETMTARRHIKDFDQFMARFMLQGSMREALSDFDVPALLALKGAERQEAEEVLIERLESSVNDPRVPRALGFMKSRRALPALRRVTRALNETAVEAALFLWELERDPGAAEALVRTLRESHIDTARLLAANALRDFPGPATEAALLQALDDEDELVRGRAGAVLMRQKGLEELAAVPRNRLFRLQALILNPLSAVRQAAIAELKELLAALAEGKRPDELGIATQEQPESPALQRLWDSVFNEGRKPEWKRRIDIDAYRALPEAERPWGEHLLLMLLGDRDLRGVHAAAELREQRALPALRELAGKRGKIAAEAQKAIAAIEGG
jgi:hypothetical protein